MKTLLSRIICVCIVLATPCAFAEEGNPGAGIRGLTVQAAYDLGHLHYAEKQMVTGARLDTDSGWLKGGYAEVRYDFQDFFVRGRYDAIGSNSATYDGSLMDGTPYRAPTKERISTTEFDLAYKLWDQDSATFSPYVGLGYRAWKRGEDVLPSYTEDYAWWYGAFGFNHAFRYDRWVFGLDFAVLYPFAMKMTTNVAGTYDKATFRIKPRPGCRIELPVSFDVVKTEDLRLMLFVTPYYEHWQVGKSDPVQMTSGGLPVSGAVFYEPKSSTDIQGVRIGFGINI